MSEQKKPLIFLRTDGNDRIATGHILRCLTIGAKLKEQGAEVWFIVSDEDSAALVDSLSKGFGEFAPDSTIVLHTDFMDKDAEIPAIRAYMEADESETHRHPDFTLIDSYFVTEDYLSCLGEYTRTGYMDDMLLFDYPVDLVVNYDIEPPVAFYTKAKRCLLGPSFAPLRPQFENVPYTVNNEVHRIFISTGGTDPYNVTTSILQRVILHDEITSDIVVGALNHHEAELEALVEQFPNQIRLHHDVTDMASLMAGCDLAVSAGGTTLYELSAVGVPTVVFSMADNQLEEAAAFDRAGITYYAGDMRPRFENPGLVSGDANETVNNMLTWLRMKLLDTSGRNQISARMREVSDGRGCIRIAEEIMNLAKSKEAN